METAGPSPNLPLHVQISELISREIAAGIWADGARLPTEQQLAVQLGVAVGTLRKALATLESRGLVERIQGSGTYVRHQARTGAIYEFFRLERSGGSTGLPSALILSLDRLAHPEAIPAFGNGGRGDVWRVRRLRLLGTTPAALEEIWFDARHAPHLDAAAIGPSIHLFYREKLGFWIARVEDRVSVAPCPDFSPAAFPIRTGAPCGYVERISWGNGGTVEEFSRNWFDPDTTRYVARWV